MIELIVEGVTSDVYLLYDIPYVFYTPMDIVLGEYYDGIIKLYMN